MQVIFIQQVVNMPSNVILGDCSVDIADDQLIIIGIEIDLSFYPRVSQLVNCLIDSEV